MNGFVWFWGTYCMILDVCKGRTVVCAWGASLDGAKRPVLFERPGVVKAMLLGGDGCRPRHLGLTGSGQPKHPLYLAGDAELKAF